MDKVKFAIIGAGNRGLFTYGKYINKFSNIAEVIAVADTNPHYRKQAKEQHKISDDNVFSDYNVMLSRDKCADAVIIATCDNLHVDPAVKAANKGYNILLEKPMAPTLEGCIEIVKAAQKNKVLLCVCHVLRYMPFYMKIKEIIDSGQIGQVCTIQYLEGVGPQHQAHSYVRGNYRSALNGSFMLLAKSCHDIDIINWLIGKKCKSVSSFGSLKHFTEENKPAEAADRCIDCKLSETKCPYSAKKFYFEKLKQKQYCWPLQMVISDFTEEALNDALKNGTYGKCVYSCDNNVVDNQVVIMNFQDNITANFTMTAFAPWHRQVKIMGSHGYIEGNEEIIKCLSFYDNTWSEIRLDETSVKGGHGNGDENLVYSFIQSLISKSDKDIRTGANETLESHLIVFAAELARLEKRIVNIDEMFVAS
jgi:predicted dehydrogenase